MSFGDGGQQTPGNRSMYEQILRSIEIEEVMGQSNERELWQQDPVEHRGLKWRSYDLGGKDLKELEGYWVQASWKGIEG